MCGFKCSVFALLVTLPCILKANEQNFRSKREEPCGGDIDLELMGGVAEIRLRTGVKNGVEFYRVLEDCTWTLKTADDHFMILKSDYFSVEKSENCFSDYVKITEKGVDETTSRHCGFDPLTYITFGNIIKLQFKSDGSSEYMGFKFTVKSVKKFLDDTFCIGSILGGEDSSIVNKDISGDNCFYRIQAPKHNDITLTLKMLDFGSASCEEESIIIYEGNSTQGRPLGTICSDNDLGILPYRASSMFIEYRNPLKLDGGRFEIEYMFVEDNLISSTTTSSVKGNDAPCGEEIDLELIDGVAEIQLRTELFNGIEFYRVNENCTWTLKTAQDNFMILKSDYFIVEESENCIWDYVEITEKGVDGTTSKYCGWDPLTYITFGSEIQLQFKSDVSYGYKGFKFIIDARGGDDSKCIGSILGGEDSRIMNKDDLEEDCFYRIQAPGDKVITLELKMLEFGSASCEEESIIIYEGHSTQGKPLGTICSDSVPGILPYHASSMFIEYRNPLKQEGERFTINYMFAEDIFTPAPVPSTTPFPFGGNNDCSRMFKGIDTDSGILVYTAPEYENNKDCIVVVRNHQLPNHVVQVEFDYFDIEESDNCIFDSLRVLSGERNDSALLGGLYCGESLHGRTFLTRGNSLRLEFKTDVSFALKGFQANISFVPNTECRCNENKMCIRQDFEKKCIRGQMCEVNSCQNGGTCIKTGSIATCYCPKGFQGEDCSDGEKSYHIRFTKAPVDRTIKRGEGHVEECIVEVPYGEIVDYYWSLKGTLIEPYSKKTGFGIHPGGILQIDDFWKNLEGQYSCIATTSGGTAEHTFEYRIAEKCNVRIFPGPQSERKKINEMALLICRVDNRAKEVRWKKDGVYIDYDKDNRIKKMANNYLRILNVRMQDAGVYQCEAEDESGCYSYKEGKLQVVDVKSYSSYIDGSFKGNNTENGINLCTESKYKNNKQLAVAVCNDNFPRHVVQIEFDYFDMENSDDCIFDSLNLLLLTGDREESSFLKENSCGKNKHRQTFVKRGNSLRLELKTDESLALKNFQTKVTFVPDTECSGICKDNMECIQDNTEKCIRGKYCDINTCQNGGTCIKNRSNEKCYCLKGFKGDDCSQRAGEFPHNIRFISAPVDRTIKRGQGHVEECKVEVQYREEVEYNWSLNGSLIDPYSKKTGFGTHPGGILQIDDFSNEMEGQYTCVATTLVGKANHTFTYTIAEDCDVRIFTGPQSEIKNINEMTLLTCHVDPRPKEVRWKKDGVYIDFPKDYRIKKMANNNLLISNVQLSDEGVYQCEAEDYNGCYSYKEGKLQVVNLKPLEKYCGISIHEEGRVMSSRISKGSEALPGMHPWHVIFRTKGGASRKLAFCGGTLISQRYVITAANCIIEFKSIFGVPFSAENVEFLLGTTDCLGTMNEGERRTVRSFTVHPYYEDRGFYENDIALIELDSLVEYNDYIRPICVEPAEYNDWTFLKNSGSFGRVFGKVAGCGATKSSFFRSKLMPEKLMDVYVPYVDRETCLESMGKKRFRLTDTMFCAGSDIGKTGDSCEGDSGDGLIMATSTRWVLTGIVSWGRGCDVDKYYGVYTNVGMFYNWIESVTKFNEEEVPDFINHN